VLSYSRVIGCASRYRKIRRPKIGYQGGILARERGFQEKLPVDLLRGQERRKSHRRCDFIGGFEFQYRKGVGEGENSMTLRNRQSWEACEGSNKRSCRAENLSDGW